MRPFLLLLVALVPLPARAFQEPPPDLRSLLAPGFLVADTNGDGHPDRIEARIVVPAGAGGTEVVAASNLAARLSFESYATGLGLLEVEGAGAPPGPRILVGRIGAVLADPGLGADALLGGLVAGEGILLRIPPSAPFPNGGVWVAGADDTGLLAAAEYLAGRYPGIWAPGGDTHESLAERIEGRVRESAAGALGGGAATVTLDRLVVSSARPGISRLAATIRLPTPEAFDTLRVALAPDAGGRSVLVPGLHRLDLTLEGPEGRTATHRISPERPWSEGQLRAWAGRDAPDFTLSELYTTGGIYRDTNQDLLPDRIEAYLSVRPTAHEGAAAALVDLSTRIAHEATGLRAPLARVAGEDGASTEPGFPIVFGVDHATTRRLLEEGRIGAIPDGSEVPAGYGFIELVGGALGDRRALVVGGADDAGLAAAARWTAGHLPSLGPHRPGAYGLAQVEDEVRRFLQARSAAGQVALALVKLDQWLDRLAAGERPGIPATDGTLPGGTPEAIRVELAVDTVPDGLATWVEDRVRARFPDLPVEVALAPSAFGAGEEVFDRIRDFPWEVDEAWEALRADVLPRIGPESTGRIELRVSEPPRVRAELQAAIVDSVRARGRDPGQVEVVVLSAYKQGFSWIEDELIPRLRAVGRPVQGIRIDYAHLEDSEELPWKAIGSDTRFLQELFPVEEILARELGIPDTAVVFRGIREAPDHYRLRALAADGSVLLDETFHARYRVLPYFALHPEYERVRVSTGWLRAELDGALAADRRIATDLDHFWDFWQGEVQPALRDYLLDLHEGRLTQATAPFFDELRIEVRLSEPNHRIGVDEEVISSLESLHNDLYFTTLALFSHLGEHYGAGGLSYPGRILPFIDPTGDGLPGRARVTLTGRKDAAAELVLRVRAAGEEGRWRYALSPLPTEAPKLRGVGLGAGGGGPFGPDRIEALLFDVQAVDSVGRLDEHRDRAAEGQIDRTFLSVEMLAGMIEVVRGLHGAGVLGDALAFDGVGELAFRFEVERADDFRRGVRLPVSDRPAPTRHPELVAEGFDWEEARRRAEAGTGASEPMVQWETPIPPEESDALLAKLAAFPEVEAHFVGTSFLGRPLWSADFLPPVEGRLRSRARLTALRPTIFLSGRQHANEVSSTSHLLRLGEHLVTDPEYRALLARVNVVLNPILNADGAQLAWEMQRVNPDFTLHAGYLGALGVDVTTGGGSDPLYAESRVRPDLMAAWLPDIFLNLHGYPSHEWVQHFSGYAAWVRGRTVAQRAWWAPRGWFIPGFTWVDDPDHPEIGQAQFAILDTIAAAITGIPEVEAMNRRQYARYARYGRQDVEGFREGFHSGMLSYLSLRGRTATGQGPTNPRILTFSATTEAPDETARGAWLELVATAGLAHTSALVRYLAVGDPRVERSAEAFEGTVTRTVTRKRPVLPPDPETTEPPTGNGPDSGRGSPR